MNKTTTIYENAEDINKVLEVILKVIRENTTPMYKFSQQFKDRNLAETCKNIWVFIRKNITYVRDKVDIEEIRTPQRTLSDKKGDCDDMAILSAVVLKNLGYNPFMYVVAFRNSTSYGHIYTGCKDFVVDGVWSKNNEHPPGITKTMELQLNGTKNIYNSKPKMKVQILSGINENFNETNRLLQKQKTVGLSEIEELKLSKLILVSQIEGKEDAEFVIQVLPYATAVNGFDIHFPNAISGVVNEYITKVKTLKGLGDIGAIDSLNGWLKDGINKAVEAARELAKKAEELAKKAKESTRIAAEKAEELARKATETAKEAARKAKEIADEVARKATEVARKAAEAARKAAEIVKDSEAADLLKKIALAPARGAFLLLLKVNFFGYATKLYLGFLDNKKANSVYGLTKNQHAKIKKASAKFLAFWKKVGGSESSLKREVNKGRGKKIADKRAGLNGIGEPVTLTAGTAAATASPIITVIVNFFKGLKLKDLLKYAKPFLEKIMNNAIDGKYNKKNKDKTPPNDNDTTPNDDDTPPNDDDTTPNDDDTTPNDDDTTPNDDTGSKSKLPLIMIGLAVVGVGYFAMKK